MNTCKSLDWTREDLSSDPLWKAARASSDRLLSFLEKSPTAWQAVAEAERQLKEAGFTLFDPLAPLKEGDRVYLKKNNSALVAFRVGKEPLKHGYRVFGAHSDSPALKIKPNAISKSEGVLRLTTEVYGGPLLNPWFDRPLSLAGRVVLKGENPLDVEERLIDFKKPILILPNAAIHMNRKANDGEKIDRAKVILPFLCTTEEDADENLLRRLIARELEVEMDEILDYELLTYEATPPCYAGLNDCFVSAGHLDNLAMMEVGLYSLMHAEGGTGLQMLLVTDNEEVGSMTKQGAAGLFARDALEAAVLALGGSRKDFLALFDKSFMISGDLTHAVHPNYPEFADPDHRPKLNEGPVVKVAAGQSYATDAKSCAIFRQLADGAGVPCQLFVNRSDKRGGSTIGPISSSLLPMDTVDVGNPVWGMHSIRETAGLLDHLYMEKIMELYWSL